jgi:uracil-DNA glycosylase family 4
MAEGWAESALDWWEEAGVDTIVGEVPRDWLNPKATTRAAPVADALPDSLEAFQVWLATSADVPLASPTASRAAPTGDPASRLMVMIDMPSPEGGLLGGEAGAMFDRMLAAIGRGRDSIYLAPLSPARTPTGSIDAASVARLGEIARHHVGLAAPKALLLFGDLCGKALLGLAVAEGRAKWHQVVTPAGPIKTLVTIRPEKLVDRPAFKKYVWEDLQMLKEELTP